MKTTGMWLSLSMALRGGWRDLNQNRQLP